MNKLFKALTLLSTAALLIGCGLSEVTTAPSEAKLSKKSKTGIILYSQSHADIGNEDYFLIAERTGKAEIKEEKRLKSSNGYWSINDFDKNNDEGNVKIVELPAGDYEFYYAYMQWGSGEHVVYWHSDDHMRFKVRAGEVTYLGNLKIKATRESTWTSYGKYKLVVENKKRRDFKYFKERMENIPTSKIKTRLVKITKQSAVDYEKDKAEEKEEGDVELD